MIIKRIKEILFPVFCAKCEKEGEWLCDSCLDILKPAPIKACPFCEQKNYGELCLACQNKCPIDGAFAFFGYDENSVLTKLIYDFKYKYTKDISFLWDKIMEKNIKGLVDFLPKNVEWAIVPVPLFKKREKERGYNQSKIIANIIKNKIFEATKENVELKKDFLKRCRATVQQAKLKKEERQKNVEGAFICEYDLANKNILLIDDVFTTGATLFECSRVLKQKKAEKVLAITLARTIRQH